MFLKPVTIIVIILIFNAIKLFSFFDSNSRELIENDSIYFQSINKIEYSPNLELFVVNQKSEFNRINIFKNNGDLFKSYLIDDSYTFKFIDSIYYDKSEVLLTKDEYNNLQGSLIGSEFTNTISQSTFLNDSILITIGTLKYLVHYGTMGGQPHFKLNKVTVLLFTNILNNDFQIKTLRFNETKVNPQPDYLKIVGNDIFFKLFPEGFLRKFPNSSTIVVGKINLIDYDWEPLVELPNEYITSNIRLSIDFNYKIFEYNNKTYFIAPFTNYIFNMEQDTIWLSDLVDPIKYSLNFFNSETINLPQEMFKLDSVSHSIIDFFFNNDFLYVLLNKPKMKDSKIYLHKYTLTGKFLKSKELDEGKKLESVFYSKIKQKLIKVYMENEDWYIDEVDIN